MPSGPKKRRAAKRRKQKMAISDSQSSSNSNPEPSPKEAEDENDEVFRTPKSEPEIPLSESESVYYSVEVKNHSRRGSSDDFKSLDFDDNTQERLNEFQLEEKDNLNVNFDDGGSRGEEFQNQREEPEEHRLNIYTYVSQEELEASEEKMSSDDQNVKVLPWLGEAICTEDFLNVNGTIDKASNEELLISADEKSEKVDLDMDMMALENREVSQDTLTNVMEKLDDEKGISLTAQSDSSDKDFVEVIGFSPVNVNNQEAGSWLDKDIQIDSDENRDSKAELHRELPTVHGNNIYLDLSGSAEDKCVEDTKLDEFLHVNDNKSTIDENKLQIEVGQQIIEKSVPFDEKTALKALVETVVGSPSKECEVKVMPWLYNDIPTKYVDVNVDVEVLRPGKEIAGFDSTETSFLCHEYDVSKCTTFESLDQPIQHNISNPKIPKGVLEVQKMLHQTDVELIGNELENSSEKSLGKENQQSINSNENLKDLSGSQEMHPQIEADLISNELGKSNEKNSGLVDSSILVCDVKSLHEEDILSPIKRYKDSVQKFNTENPKDSTEIPEILPLTYVELISDEPGKSVEKSPVLFESSIPICEEEGLNMIATENSAEQEEDILSPMEISKDSVNTVNIEKPKDSSEVQEILPLTDVELISSDFSTPVEERPGLVESSILICEEEGLNVTAIENSVEEEENIPFIESPKNSGNIYSTENSKDSAEVQEIPPQTEVELISNDLGKSVEKSSESSSLICEQEGLNVIATGNLVEQEEDILTVIEGAKESAQTNQEIHHHTDVFLNNDESQKTTENSSKYAENLTGEKESLPFVNVEKLNKEIHIDTACSIDMVQEKLSSESVNNQSVEIVDKCAGLDEDYILNPEGMNQNGHDYLESLIGSNSVSSQPSMKESQEFSSSSEHTENMKKIEVAPKAVRPRTTIWNCCGLLEAFASSDR